MSKRNEEMDIQLELKERLPFIEILSKSLLSIKSLLEEPDANISQIQWLIRDLYTDIPDSWISQSFVDDVTKCMVMKVIDVRVRFAGVPLSKEYHERRNIEMFKHVKIVDYFMLKNAIINLLDGLNMLVRKEKIEMTTGMNMQFENIEEFEKSLQDDVSDGDDAIEDLSLLLEVDGDEEDEEED